MGFFDFFRRREVRQQPYTDAIIDRLIADANGVEEAARIAVSEAVAGLWARAFASATVEPMTPATMGLRPRVLELIGRNLVSQGEILFLIEFVDGGLTLQSASSWNVTGDDHWQYEVTLTRPSSSRTVYRPAEAVLHLRYGSDYSTPWTAAGPEERAKDTGQLASNIEKRLAEEAGAPVGSVVPVPDTSNVDKLQGDLQALKGNSILVPSTTGGWDVNAQTRDGTTNDWQPRRFGANPPAVLAAIRQGAGDDIAISAGIAPALIRGDAEGTAMREAWRQFLHGTIQPVANIQLDELQEKLDTPSLTLSFEKLMASDIQGRARSFQSMVGGGMEVERAAQLSGLMMPD